MPYEKVGKNEPVCIADEVPFDIPESWEWVRLQNICNIVSARRVHQSDWKSSGIPFYRAREIGVLADKGKVDNDLFVSEELYNDFAKSGVPHPGDLMVTAVGTLGKVYVVQPQDRFYYKDASVICFENFGRTIPEYLQLVMMSPYMTSLIKSKSTGTTVGTITIVCAKQYLIPIPPLDEQRKIIKRLDNLKLLIESYAEEESALSKLNTQFPEILKKSILQYAVQGKLVPQNPADEPASVLLERIRAEKEQLIKAGKIKRDKHESVIFRRDNSYYEKVDEIERCIDDEIPFEIPENWEWVRFFSIVEIATNLVSPERYFDYMHIAPDNIEKSTGTLLECRTVAQDKVSSPNHLFFKGQILYSKIRPLLRKAVIAPFDGLCSADMYPLKTPINKEYLLRYILSDSFNAQVATAMSSRVKMPKINQAELSKVLIPVPPIQEQNRIANKIKELYMALV